MRHALARARQKRGGIAITASGGNVRGSKTFNVISWVTLLFTAVTFSLLSAATVEALPAGRAYELVSPPDTGSVTPIAAAIGASDGFDCFDTNLATPNGEGVAFASELGALEGLVSNGVFNLYESHRTSSGWITGSLSASGQQTTFPNGGLCLSPDHNYSTLLTGPAPNDQGSLVLNGAQTSYVRTPAGAYELVGVGRLATDQKANVKWISPGGGHIVFTAVERLEPPAPVGIGSHATYDPQSPVNAVYDRTPAGVEVVSVLPSGVAPDPASEATYYRGTSFDGSSVVFETVKNTGVSSIYEHRGGGPSKPVATGAVPGAVRYGGISADGTEILYLETVEGSGLRGNLYLFDGNSGNSVPVISGAKAAIVNFSEDGSTVYFTSQQEIAGSGQNPLGDSPVAGQPNLYVWTRGGGGAEFVATVSPADVEGELSQAEDLTEWLRAVAAPQQDGLTGRLNATSRTTPDGSTFLFQTEAAVTGFDTGGNDQIYRYDRTDEDLDCLSCPAAEPASSEAFLQRRRVGPIVAVSSLDHLANISDDGRIAFFMTGEALVGGDINEVVDVYQWREGEVSLVSGGKGQLPSVLYAMSSDARDVFFVTTDRLVSQDPSSVLSLYDARVGGGFPSSPEPVRCQLEATCTAPPTASPAGSTAGSDSFIGAADPKPKRHKCRKRLKHKKQRCVRKGRRHK